jgi:hypothetical protein
LAVAPALVPGPASTTAPPEQPAPAPGSWDGGPIEFDRVVPPSGNMWVAGRQFWLGPARAGTVIRFWAGTQLIHLSAAGARIKTLRSHLSVNDLAKLTAAGAVPAGPAPLPAAGDGPAIEVDRPVSRGGLVSLGYAVTDHVAQGRTVHTGLAVITGAEDRQHAYVALTRGTDTNTAYVFTLPPRIADPAPGPRPAPELVRYDKITTPPAVRPNPAAAPVGTRDALAVLSDVLERDGQQLSAREIGRGPAGALRWY